MVMVFLTGEVITVMDISIMDLEISIMAEEIIHTIL